MKAYKIPKGLQWQYYRQYNGFDALLPTLLKDGTWVISESAILAHETKYITNFAKSGATQDVKEIVQKTIDTIKGFELIEITKEDLHPIQKTRQAEPTLDEKTLVEGFLKDVLADKYDVNKTIKQVFTDIQAKAIPLKI